MSEVKVNKISPRTNCGTVTLGDSGDTIALGSGATQTGFGRTGTVNWVTTPKTGDFTAVNGEGYFVNTTSGVITMTMPSGSAGAIVSIQDYNKTFDDNAFTVTPASGEKINGGGADGDLKISTEGQGLTFVYVDSTVGWKTVHENDFITPGSDFVIATGGTITTSGDYKIHTFTGPGTFCVSALAVAPANNVADYVVVAGGGGGGQADPMPYSASGGGGAGGYRESVPSPAAWTGSPLANPGNARPITIQGYPITVHGGGAVNTPGGTSTFSDISSAGGGRGGHGQSDPTVPGVAGGSGGGGTYNAPPSPVPVCGGAGNTPPVSPPQGSAGGNGNTSNGAGAGGGGATAVGGNVGPPAPNSGAGGAGATSSINATPTARAGGGGGGNDTSGQQGAGGTGGGGAGGSPSTSGTATAGTANSGGGGGGSGNANPCTGGAGGSGIVIIRYKFQ
jgi:hypothetical protein